MLLRLGGNQIHSPTRFFAPVLRRTFMMMAPRFIPSHLDVIEDVEDYQPGGYHPISVGDTFDHGRFRVLHKLGFGGSSRATRGKRETGVESSLSRRYALMSLHPRSRARSPNWLFPKSLERLSLFQSLSTSRLSITISSYKVQTAPTYSLYSLLLAPVSMPCLTLPGELPVVGDYVQSWLGRSRNKQR